MKDTIKFTLHDNTIMRIRQIMQDIVDIEKDVYFVQIKGNKPSLFLTKAKDNLLLCIKVLQNQEI